jgi:uncharacterized protein DUF6046
MAKELNTTGGLILKTAQVLHVPGKESVIASTIPNIPKQTPDAFAKFKQARPDIIARSFGLPFAQSEIYKGKIQIAVRDQPFTTRTSKLGTAIFSDLQFIEIGGFKHIPIDCVLFNVRQSKNIVITNIQGRDGSIKEYIGLSDYEINIKGVILGDNGVYPFDQVSNLVEFLRYDQSIGIVSQYLNNIFDINEIVIKEYAFEQEEGSQSYQKFEILAYSEKPVEILIQEAK